MSAYPRVFLAGHTACHNRGNEAIARVLVKELSERIPGVRCVLGTNDVDYDKHRLADTTLDVRQNRLVRTIPSRKARALHKVVKRFPGHWTPLVSVTDARDSEDILGSDLVVFTGGDHFCYGLQNTLSHAGRLLLAKAARIPVAVYGASVNALRPGYELDYLKFLLNEFDYISVRESASFETITGWNLDTPVELVADPAFLLKPSPTTRITDILSTERLCLDGNVIGVSVSFTAAEVADVDAMDCLRMMAKALDQFVEKNDYNVLLIPHVDFPGTRLRGKDKMASWLIRGLMDRTDRCDVLMGDYNAQELKGIISRCTIFCGFRTHATIAAVSSCVPTLFIAYSTKAHGISTDLYGTDRWCLDATDVARVGEELVYDRLSQLHRERDALRARLRESVPGMQTRARNGIESLCNLVRH